MSKVFNYRNEESLKRLKKASKQAFDYNHNYLSRDEQWMYLNEWLGEIGTNSLIKPPFNCDFGDNIFLGRNTFINVNAVIFDRAKVLIGNNVLIGPNVGIYTSVHPLDIKSRNEGLMMAKEVIIEDNVWIGANVTITAGVKIKSGAVIGAGSLVNKDVDSNSFYAGNPAKFIRIINQEEIDINFK